MTRERIDLGRLGERAACEAVEARGLVVVDRNARLRSGELDLVALDGTTLAFIEVRARRATGLGTDPVGSRPILSIDARKQLKVRTVAREWLHLHGSRYRWEEIRFDAVGVLVAACGGFRVEYLRGAF